MFRLPSPLHEWIMAIPLWILLTIGSVGLTIAVGLSLGSMLGSMRDK